MLLGDANRTPDRAKRAGITEGVPGEPERVQGRGLCLPVTQLPGEGQCTLGGGKTRARVFLNECEGLFGKRKCLARLPVPRQSLELVSDSTLTALPRRHSINADVAEDEMTNRLTRAELLRRAALGSAVAASPGLFAGAAPGAVRRPALQVNGNKPKVKYLNAFTTRVAQHSRVAYYPVGGGKGDAAVAMVIDEILVSPKAAKVLGSLFKKRKVVNTNKTVFGGLKPRPSEDVQIWRLKGTLGKQAHPDVAMLVWEARRLLQKAKIPPEQVAPNHVLIPSPNYHTCPGGPPDPHPVEMVPSREPSAVEVVVIDSGYVDDGWVFYEKRIDVLERGQWFSGTPVPGSSPARFTSPYTWTDEPPEPRFITVHEAIDYPTPKNHLATLVAHANFVVGVIAQACPQARIRLVNHNGGFIESVDTETPIPTEASVARSLLTHRNAAVINVGFAFATLPRKPSGAAPPVPSWPFELALRGMNPTTMVVAPAGNQNCPIPQYPAAFHLDKRHPNVIGVGSIAPPPNGVSPPPPLQRSHFSNYGPWVACCTEGEDVVSSFIRHWAGPTEDAEPANNPGGYPPGGYPDKTFTGWAFWSGTSFAAPKVAGAIANGVVQQGQSPLGAWQALPANPTDPAIATALGMGKILSGLPPV